MSSNNLNDPQVLANHIKSKILEADGKFFNKENVLVYVDNAGNQYVVPEEIKELALVNVEKKKVEKEKVKEAKKTFSLKK
jgi:hypothetical protein